MKKQITLLIAFSFAYVLLSPSCQVIVMPEGLEIPLDTIRYYDSLAQHRYDVVDKDIQHYLESKVNTKSNRPTTITPIISEGLTLAYLITYEKGWELLSADKRMSPIIAFSHNDVFPINNLAMTQFLSSDLEAIECLKKRIITVSAEDTIVNNNLSYWAKFSKDNTPNTKADGDPFEEEKYWELVDSEWIIDIVEEPVRLIQTRWHQLAPWNKYSPKWGPNETLRDPAGCSAIAVSQMLYFADFFSYGRILHWVFSKLGRYNVSSRVL